MDKISMSPEPLFPVENTNPLLGINFPLKTCWHYSTILNMLTASSKEFLGFIYYEPLWSSVNSHHLRSLNKIYSWIYFNVTTLMTDGS